MHFCGRFHLRQSLFFRHRRRCPLSGCRGKVSRRRTELGILLCHLNQDDWRSLLIKVARREWSSSITPVNFSASPSPGSTRITTASALICPSSTRNSKLTPEPKFLGMVVSKNRPPKLIFRTREMSSRPAQRQSTHTPEGGVLTREVNLLEGEADCFNMFPHSLPHAQRYHCANVRSALGAGVVVDSRS